MLSGFIIKKCGGTQEPAARAKAGKAAGVVGIICNAALFAAKLISGVLMRSVAVIADAVNNLSDASSNVVAYMGFKMASRPADKQHPYGHGRYEYLSALFIAVLILIIGGELLFESVKKIITPAPIQFSWIIVGVLAASVLVKLWMCLFYRRLGKKINSQTLSSASADSRNDVIATAAILTALIISHYTSVDLDGPMGVAVALFIIFSGFAEIKKTIDPLLGKAPDKKVTESIKERILGYEGVIGTHDLMVHDYGPGRQFASVHVEMPAERGLVECHEIIDTIERDFLTKDGLHLVIHLDPVDWQTRGDNARVLIEECVKSVDARLTVHDLRVVREGCKVKFTFDCVIPEELGEKETRQAITEAVKKRTPDCECEINVDRDFAYVSK